MKTFREYLKRIKPQVDERIGAIVLQKLREPDLLPMLMKGKRLRAGLLLLVFDSLCDDNQVRNAALDLACAVELAHSASLIVDDMLDDDTERRGLPSLHLTKGHKEAMLNTIGILSLPYDIASSYGKRFVKILAETQRNMVGGVAEELFHQPDFPSLELYHSVIAHKTGKSFSLAAQWGCMAARCVGCDHSDLFCPHQDEAIHFSNYGVYCGRAMQVADDIADLQLAIRGKKPLGFGSERLLLRCMNMGNPIEECSVDLNSGSFDLSMVKKFWPDAGTQEQWTKILNAEIDNAKKAVNGFLLSVYNKELLTDTPSEIAHMMLNEG